MILKYFRPREWGLVLLCAVMIIIQVYLDLRIPEYMNAMTEAILRGETADLFSAYGIGMLACAFLSLAVSLVAGYLAALVTSQLCLELRRMQFSKVQTFSAEDVGDISIASLITRSTSDVYQIQIYVARGLQVLIKSPILAVWAILKIAGKNWEWTIVTAVAVIIILIVVTIIIQKSRMYFKKIQWLTDNINRGTGETIEGVRTIRAYNAEEYQFAKLESANEALIRNNLASLRYTAVMYPFTSMVQNLLTLSIYWVGALLIARTANFDEQLVLFSDMIVFSSYALMVVSAFLMISGMMRIVPRAMVASQRIQEVIDREPSIIEGEESSPVSGQEGTISLDHVTFTYPGAKKPAVSDITLEVRKGQTLAIIGSTGSGKTTILRLISRLYDSDEGEVTVGGRNVREYHQKSLHNMFGYVPQTAVIFSGSVRYNVNYGSHAEERTEDDIWEALRVAQADSFVKELDGGLDASIAQHGRNISGGQKQRIGIARAICKAPEIYIFDDSFSALDFKTDRALRSALRKKTSDSTVIIVAQRVGTVMDADCIVVMDKGRIVGKGTHDELMQNCPLYNEIATAQFSEVF